MHFEPFMYLMKNALSVDGRYFRYSSIYKMSSAFYQEQDLISVLLSFSAVV